MGTYPRAYPRVCCLRAAVRRAALLIVLLSCVLFPLLLFPLLSLSWCVSRVRELLQLVTLLILPGVLLSLACVLPFVTFVCGQ